MVWDIVYVWKRRMGIVAYTTQMAWLQAIKRIKNGTGTQILMEIKKNKLNDSSKWFTWGQKIRP